MNVLKSIIYTTILLTLIPVDALASNSMNNRRVTMDKGMRENLLNLEFFQTNPTYFYPVGFWFTTQEREGVEPAVELQLLQAIYRKTRKFSFDPKNPNLVIKEDKHLVLDFLKKQQDLENKFDQKNLTLRVWDTVDVDSYGTPITDRYEVEMKFIKVEDVVKQRKPRVWDWLFSMDAE
jgi:hypothetical protein